ncbi:MAG: hypothetical protein ACLFVU_12870 [Phycisphaerae bacterium]
MAETQNRQSRSLSWLIAAVAAMLAIVAVAAGSWYFLGRRTVWTDGDGIRRADSAARVRQVLWANPESLPEQINTIRQEYEPCLSADGKELYFVRGLPKESADIYVSYKVDGKWTPAEPLIDIRSPADELGPRLTADGQVLVFYSNREGGFGGYDIYASRRTGSGWGEPVNLGPAVNTEFNEYSPCPTPDGRLIFATNRKAAAKLADGKWRATIRQGDPGDYDLFIADPASDAAQSQPVVTEDGRSVTTRPLQLQAAEELQGVNSPYHEGACSLTEDGEFLYFASNRPGGFGQFDLYRCRLDGNTAKRLHNLGPEINSAANEADPHLAMGGFLLYFSSDRSDGQQYDLYKARSKEVYAVTDRRDMPLGWGWWALLIALALLVPLLMFMRGIGYKHLSTIQKCLAISLLVHILLTILLGLYSVSTDIYEYVARESGMETAVNLEISREVEVKLQAREQVSELPVADATLTDVQRTPSPSTPKATAPPLEQNVPPSQINPSPIRLEAKAPQEPAPEPPQERLELPKPELVRQEPDIEFTNRQKVKPTEAAEPSMEPELESEIVKTEVETGTPIRKPEKVEIAAAPTEAMSTSMVREVETTETTADAPEKLSPTIEVRVAPEVEVSGPSPKATKVAATQPAGPYVTESDAELARTETATSVEHDSDLTTNPVALPTTHVIEGSSVAVRDTETSEIETEHVPVAVNLQDAAADITITPPSVPAAKVDSEQTEQVGIPEQPTEELTRSEYAAGPARESLEPVSTERLPNTEAEVTESLAHASAPNVADVEVEAVAPIAPLIGPGGTLDAGRLASPESFHQRSYQQRQRLVEEMGGSKESEAAVARALVFLSRHQEKDGRWTNIDDHGRRRRWHRNKKQDNAVTGLALLTFLASDHTPTNPGPYQETAKKGVDYLLKTHKGNGDLRGGGDMYDQGIATLALSEAAIMTGEEKYKKVALQGAKFILKAQNQMLGGWRYQPNERSCDTSVLGWQAMALHSCKRLGFKLPERNRKLALKWLNSVSRSEHKMLAGYTNPSATPAMTAEAAFSRMLLGQELSREQAGEAGEFILRNQKLKGQDNYYFYYYASMAMMQMQGRRWDKWNTRMRDYLVAAQQKSGKMAGSWDDNSKWGNRGGRVYSTALSTLTLEVYYRYLPMYKKNEGQKK